MRLLSVLLPVALSLTCGCDVSFGGPVSGPPDPPGDVDLGPPKEDAPTGSKWAESDEIDACGRTQRRWVLVDEVCYGTDEPDYLEHFRTPMFRDGIRIDGTLYSVDGTHLWAVGADDLQRRSLGAYPGHPIAVDAYQSRLLIAAADGGLLMLDTSTPERPRIVDRVRFDGPAMGVRVDGEMAWVGTGDEGIVGVELGKSGFGRLVTAPVPAGSYAAAAEYHGRLAYVAACDRLAIIDPISGETVGEVWFDTDVDIPARDVAVTGGVAFVAAGKTGAVAIDVSDPTNPRILGNCRIEDEAYYASGVRTDGKRLYVAGGEWGVQIVDVTDPHAACTAVTLPTNPASNPASCEEVPPWEVVDWTIDYEPPPPARDPIAVRIDGDRLYAFGDARRIGFRAVDIWDVSDDAIPEGFSSQTNDWLSKIDRYQEPNLVERLVANDRRVLVTGDGGGLFERTDDLLVRSEEQPRDIHAALAAHFLRDGRWVVVMPDGDVELEGTGSPIASGLDVMSPQLVQEADDTLLVSTRDGFERLRVDGSMREDVLTERAELPAAMTAHDGDVVVAAPEWTRARGLSGTELPEHGVFDAADIMDVTRWRTGVPRRLLTSNPAGLVELASLGDRASLVLHRPSMAAGEPTRVALPAGDYADLASSGDSAYTVAHDRGLYRSQLLVIDLSQQAPEVVETITFTGVTTSVAVAADRLYVGDADTGVVVFDITDGIPTRLGHVALEETHELD